MGLLAAGAGALGAAFYLGRRSAARPPCERQVAGVRRAVHPAKVPVSGALEPLIAHTVHSVVTALSERLKSPPAR